MFKKSGFQGLSQLPILKVRVQLARRGTAMGKSHIQQIEMIRRALKSSGWPLSLSQSKRPKIRASFGPAISVGYESETEFFDVDLKGKLDFKKGIKSLQEPLDEGYRVLSIKSIPRFFPSLEESVNLIFYEIKSPLLVGTQAKWEFFWEKKEYKVKKVKEDREEWIDARQCVKAWKLKEDRLNLQVRVGPRRTLKPERIIQAVCELDESQVVMGSSLENFKIVRTRLCLEKSDGRTIDL